MRYWPSGIHRHVWLALCLGVGANVATWGSEPLHWGQGTTRNQVADGRNLPDAVNVATGLNVVWSAELGTESHGTPMVAGGRVYIGTNNGHPRDARYPGDRGVFQAYDERDGTFLWQLVIPKYSDDPYQDWPNAGICSTATVDGDRVLILSNRGEALCLDVQGQANGNDGPYMEEAQLQARSGEDAVALQPTQADVLWRFDIHGRVASYPHDAAHSSFLQVGDYIYINTGNGVDNTHRKVRRPDAPSLIVLDRRDGHWVAQDGEHIGPRIFHSTWSSPAYGEVRGRGLIIFCGGDGVVYAFEPVSEAPRAGSVLTLKKLWSFDCDPTGPKEDVHRFNGNRKVSPSNIKSMPVLAGDRVYVTVGGDLWWGKNEAWLKCIDATGEGDVTASAEVWSYPLVRHSMSTPAVQDGLVYAADCGQQLHCVDAVTGQAVWVHDAEGEVWASPMVAEGKIYLGTRRGDLWILAAGRERRVLSKARLDSPISSTATIEGGRVYLATMERLYAFARTGEAGTR